MTEPAASSRGSTLVAARVASFVMTAALGVGLARILGRDEFGEWSAAQGVAGLLLLFGALGVDQLYLRGDTTLDALRQRSAQLTVGSLVLGAVLVLSWPSLDWAARVAGVLLVIASSGDQLKLAYLLEPQRAMAFNVRARRELLVKAVECGVTVGAALVITTAVGAGLGAVVGSVMLLFIVGPLTWPRAPESTAAKDFRLGIGFATSAALYTAYFQIDAALLAALRPAVEVGQYRVAYSLLAAVIVFPIVVNNDILRVRLYNTAAEDRRTVERRFLIISVTAGILGVAALVGLAPALVHVAFGTEYEPAVELTRILALCLPAHFFNSWAGNVLVSRRQLRRVVGVQAAMLSCNVAANAIAIPIHGARGAAVVTIATEVLGSVLYILTLRTARRSADARR